MKSVLHSAKGASDLFSLGTWHCHFPIGFKIHCSSLWKVEVGNSNSYWDEAMCRMNWTGYYGFYDLPFFSLDKHFLIFFICPASSHIKFKRVKRPRKLLAFKLNGEKQEKKNPFSKELYSTFSVENKCQVTFKEMW